MRLANFHLTASWLQVLRHLTLKMIEHQMSDHLNRYLLIKKYCPHKSNFSTTNGEFILKSGAAGLNSLG
jgi:hypothetical protein